MSIHSVKIRNFKSIRETDEIHLKSLNVLIGANGAGKTNFISFFKFLNKLSEQHLQLYISQNGRSDNFLYFGNKVSDSLRGKIIFDNEWRNEYRFKMVPDQSGSLIFAWEWSNLTLPGTTELNKLQISEGGNRETVLPESGEYRNNHLNNLFQSFKIFHFHDTSFNSKVKQPCVAKDYASLHEDGSNLAAFLYRIQESKPQHFSFIVKVIQSIAPFFQGFYLQPDEIDPNYIFLRWREKGSDQLFTAHNFSDGTLRMICLVTLLMQPELPDTIIIDEPELGLHPFAISKLASMIKIASKKAQIIISTQSTNLVDQFAPDDIIVVERESNQSVFKRLNEESLLSWREEYSLGELWSKNILGGTP